MLALLLCTATRAVAGEDTGPERRGLVVDKWGSAIPAAQYTVRSLGGLLLQQGLTASDGSFVLRGLPPGSYWLELRATQFQPQRVRLEIGGQPAPPLRIALDLASFESEVTVTAQRGMVVDLDEAPPVVTVRDQADFRGRPLATIGQALEGAAGVMVQQSTYGQVSPFLRGLTGYHVLNLVDGVRFNNSTFRSGPNQYLALVDPAHAHRVEALLGPASSQFGSDAMGGAIQVLTPPMLFADRPAAVMAASANLFAATADRSAGGDASIFVRARNLSWTAGGVRREIRDLRAGRGTDSHHVLRRLFGLTDRQIQDVTGSRQQDTGFAQSGAHTKLAARLGDDQTLTLWYQRSSQDAVRGSKDLWGGLGRLRSDFDPQRLRFFYTRYERAGAGPLDWLSGTVSVNSQTDGSLRQGLRTLDPIVQDHVRARAIGYAAQAGRRIAGRHTLVFGGEIYDEGIDAGRAETDPRSGVVEQKRALYPNGSTYRTSGFFAQNVSALGPNLTAQLGGRFTHVYVRTEADRNVADSGMSLGVVDAAQRYHDWTFSSGLTWRSTEALSFHALAGRGFRAPNLNDLGALGLNDLGYEVPAESAIGTGALVGSSDGEGAVFADRAVASLTSERLFNVELGMTMRWRGVHTRLQAFHAELKDPIVRRTLLFPISAAPGSLAGLPVNPIDPTAAQRQQGVVAVATALDPRAVKAFVNDGRSRYYGADAQVRVQMARRWLAEASYSYLVGHDLNPTRAVRRLPPQQGFLAVRYQPESRVISWLEARAWLSGAQEHLSGGDLTDERIGAARRRSDITDFFGGARIRPFIGAGGDGLFGTLDDVFEPTGETVAQIRDRVLPIGQVINGVLVVDDGTRVPLYRRTPGFLSLDVRAVLKITERLETTVALVNVLDTNYRVHGSGVDAPGINLFAAVRISY